MAMGNSKLFPTVTVMKIYVLTEYIKMAVLLVLACMHIIFFPEIKCAEAFAWGVFKSFTHLFHCLMQQCPSHV